MAGRSSGATGKGQTDLRVKASPSYPDATAAVADLAEAAVEGDAARRQSAEQWLTVHSDQAVTPLRKLLNDETAAIASRIAACRELARCGLASQSALLEALRSDQSLIQRNALKALSANGNADGQVIRAIASMMSARDEQVRWEAIRALERIGPPAKPHSRDQLLSILNDANQPQPVRDAARSALERICPRDTLVDE